MPLSCVRVRAQVETGFGIRCGYSSTEWTSQAGVEVEGPPTNYLGTLRW